MLNQTGIIILAAGSSSRLGQSKQLLPYNGKSLLKHTVHAALGSVCSPIVVVLGARADVHQTELNTEPVTVIINNDWEKGIGCSIRYGLNKLLEESPDIRACVILLCDQPFINSSIIQQLIDAFATSGKGIIASEYAATLGTPALFKKDYFADLLCLKENQGAKILFTTFKQDLSIVAFPAGETDIDTLEDYNQLVQNIYPGLP